MPRRSYLSILALTSLLCVAGCTDDANGGGGGGTQTSQGGGGQGGDTGGGAGGGSQSSCASGTKDGPVDGAEGEQTPLGVDYNVRTPADYDATVGHPLLVVYSPATMVDPTQVEELTGLTDPATARGYVVAYLSHVPAADEADWDDAGSVPEQIIARWCIDERRVYTTGQSDGGTIASITGMFDVTNPRPAAIAANASGVSTVTLNGVDCPAPLPVMVLHSENDSHYPVPSFGLEPSQWWADCASCTASGTTLSNGCVAYDGCDDGVEVQYCEGSEEHNEWPPMNEAILDFFDRFVAP